MAEGGAGQTPDVVVGEVECLQLGQTTEGVLLELERHRARPLTVVSLDTEQPQVLEANK